MALAAAFHRSCHRVTLLNSTTYCVTLTMDKLLHTSGKLEGKNIRTGVPKITNNRSKPLTYEQAQKPSLIGVTKYWNSINTSGLFIEKEYEKWLRRSSETATDDVFIRKFINGTYQQYLLSEVIIKRRANIIVLSFLVRSVWNAKQLYFLQGYSETILSKILKCPVKVEIRLVDDSRKLMFKKI